MWSQEVKLSKAERSQGDRLKPATMKARLCREWVEDGVMRTRREKLASSEGEDGVKKKEGERKKEEEREVVEVPGRWSEEGLG